MGMGSGTGHKGSSASWMISDAICACVASFAGPLSPSSTTAMASASKTYDPGYKNTASCTSRITFINGLGTLLPLQSHVLHICDVDVDIY
eukprot:1389328-Amorphochlora_amoeboformis.AAC.3